MTTEKIFHTLKGTAVDIETVIRLRSWMEDEVRKTQGKFKFTSLITDYDKETETFEFKLHFHR